MKKILLSIVALMAIVLNVKAADEPTYTAKGALTAQYPTYTALASGVTDIPVDVYGSDSIIVHSWCGVEGYDVCVIFDESGYMTNLKVVENGVSRERASKGYRYAYTGLTSCSDFATYVLAWGGLSLWYNVYRRCNKYGCSGNLGI